MGDVLTLIGTRSLVDMDQAQEMVKKMKSGKGFDLEDFKLQMQMKRWAA